MHPPTLHSTSARFLSRSTPRTLRQSLSLLPRTATRSLHHHHRHLSPVPRRPTCTPRARRSNLAPSLPSSSASFHSSALVSSPAPQDFNLSDVGEGIVEVEIIKWFVKEGDQVAEFDPVCEVQSDKASVEITSRYAGKIVELCHAVGDVARVGKPLCKIEMVPEEAVEEDAGAAPVATNDAPANGLTSSGADISGSTPSTPSQTTRTPKPIDARGMERREALRTLATPAVRRMTREHGIDIASIEGTGREGRVLKEDVVAAVERRSAGGLEEISGSMSTSSTSSSNPSSSTSTTLDEAPTTMPLTPMRRAMFRAMTSTWSAPHFGYSEEIDVTALDALRKDVASATGTKLTLLAFLIKAMSLALEDHAIFRSTLSINPGAQGSTTPELITRQTHDISIALSSPHGLVTPTLPDVRHLNILDIARHMSDLQTAASGPKGLSRSQLGLRTGTVTLSNIGSVGGVTAAPLLPPTGQLVIGALGRARILPRYITDEDELPSKRLILPASFSADHRVVEGAELAHLVKDWKELCERPAVWWARMK